MLIGTLLLLALASAEGPVATSPNLREAPAARAGGPGGAPEDDYGFVAWCHGALSGHMEMRDLIKDELDQLSPGAPEDDSEQQKAGETYLELYTQALRAAERASATAIQARGAEAHGRGYRIWAAARNAEPRTRMWSYLMWELPPRCETAARKLVDNSDLLAEALRPGVAQPSQARPPSGEETPSVAGEATAATDTPPLRGLQ